MSFFNFKPQSELYKLIYREVLWVLAFHNADGDVDRYFIAASVAKSLEREIKNYIKENKINE